MVRKNKKDWTTIGIRKHVLKELDGRKVHKNQSYSEVIEILLNKSKIDEQRKP